MKKQKKRMKVASPIVTVVLFVAAVGLLLGSSIGGTRAALTYYSETYTSRIQMYDIGITLVAGGSPEGDARRGGGFGSWEKVSGEPEGPQYGEHQ